MHNVYSIPFPKVSSLSSNNKIKEGILSCAISSISRGNGSILTKFYIGGTCSAALAFLFYL